MYDALVLPGGHGTLWDINQDEHVQKLLREKIEEAGALVICHAVGVLGFMPELTEGRNITGFPNEWEEEQVDKNEVRKGEKLPYRVEDRVKEAGGNWDAELDSDTSMTVDGKLVTARGPESSQRGAEKFLEVLEE
ncbi:MAG: type 1 glutamine amidotransferase domain-containing protein, partial [Nanohaloarchaea archaeon QH_8_44_6]